MRKAQGRRAAQGSRRHPAALSLPRHVPRLLLPLLHCGPLGFPAVFPVQRLDVSWAVLPVCSIAAHLVAELLGQRGPCVRPAHVDWRDDAGSGERCGTLRTMLSMAAGPGFCVGWVGSNSVHYVFVDLSEKKVRRWRPAAAPCTDTCMPNPHRRISRASRTPPRLLGTYSRRHAWSPHHRNRTSRQWLMNT